MFGEKFSRCVARDAGGVTQQMVNGYLVSGVFAVIGQISGDRRIELDLSLLNELQNQRSRELFGDGANSKFCFGAVRNFPFHVGHSEPLPKNGLACFGNQDAAVELSKLEVLIEQATNLRRVIFRCRLWLRRRFRIMLGGASVRMEQGQGQD